MNDHDRRERDVRQNSKGVLVTLLVLVSCNVWVLRSEAEPPALARLSGAEKERVAKLIEGAKKEGKLVGYSLRCVRMSRPN